VARVLIIEDDPEVRRVYADLLYYNGFEVAQAATAVAGMDEISRQRPDAIVMDIYLPGVNGLQMAELLKSAVGTKDIPIICVSAYDVPTATVLASGCATFLRKPVKLESLVRALDRELKQPRHASDPAARLTGDGRKPDLVILDGKKNDTDPSRRVFEMVPDGLRWKVRERYGFYITSHASRSAAIAEGDRVASASRPSQLLLINVDGTLEAQYNFDLPHSTPIP
jgi:CheY-like chemotaxis protein